MLKLLILLTMINMGDKDYQTTPTGLMYKFHTKKESRKAAAGDIIKMHLIMKNDADSVISDTHMEGGPVEFQLTPPSFKGDLLEGLAMMAKGDSATFLINADSLFKGNHPPQFKKGSKVKFDITMLEVMNMDEYAAKLKNDEAARCSSEKLVIEEYIKKNNLSAKSTPSGLYYIVENEGTGEPVKTGQDLTVHYRGTLMDGTKFDASYDRNQPFTFKIGQGQVIKGWDEGIALFRKGGKGKLIIPSNLGYGSRGAGGVIKPNSILIFDIEVLDYK